MDISDEDKTMIKEARDLLNIFKDGIITTKYYRQNIIKKIKSKYTIDKFHQLEILLEKLFWNLRYKLGFSSDGLHEFDINELDIVLDKLKKDTYYRSFINKLVNIDDKNSKVYYKRMEGSAKIFDKNDFNLLSSFIFCDDELYTAAMNGTLDVKSIQLPKYYFQFDYGFPNLNMCAPLLGTVEFRKRKIQKMLFDDDFGDNWSKLIK